MKNTKKDKERARIFRLIGGRWHDNKIRMYAPFDEVVFMDGSQYDLIAPVEDGGEWVYAHHASIEVSTEEEGS